MMQQPQHTPIAKPRSPVLVRRSLVMLVIAGLLFVVAYALMDSDDPGQVQAPPVQATTMNPQLAGVVAELPADYRDLPPDQPPPPPPAQPAPTEPPAPPAQPSASTQPSTNQTPVQKTPTGQQTRRQATAKPA